MKELKKIDKKLDLRATIGLDTWSVVMEYLGYRERIAILRLLNRDMRDFITEKKLYQYPRYPRNYEKAPTFFLQPFSDKSIIDIIFFQDKYLGSLSFALMKEGFVEGKERFFGCLIKRSSHNQSQKSNDEFSIEKFKIEGHPNKILGTTGNYIFFYGFNGTQCTIYRFSVDTHRLLRFSPTEIKDVKNMPLLVASLKGRFAWHEFDREKELLCILTAKGDILFFNDDMKLIANIALKLQTQKLGVPSSFLIKGNSFFIAEKNILLRYDLTGFNFENGAEILKHSQNIQFVFSFGQDRLILFAAPSSSDKYFDILFFNIKTNNVESTAKLPVPPPYNSFLGQETKRAVVCRLLDVNVQSEKLWIMYELTYEHKIWLKMSHKVYGVQHLACAVFDEQGKCLNNTIFDDVFNVCGYNQNYDKGHNYPSHFAGKAYPMGGGRYLVSNYQKEESLIKGVKKMFEWLLTLENPERFQTLKISFPEKEAQTIKV